MRVIKFRAYAKYTINCKYNFAHKEVEKEYTGHFDDYRKLGNKNNYNNFDEWYEAQSQAFSNLCDNYKGKETIEEYKLIYGDKFNINGDGKICRQYGYENLKIMQYTGLKDKNGVEICEGDIIDFGGSLYKIVFNRGCFYMEDSNEADMVPGILDIKYHELSEVVGNIYENPELLK